VRFLAWIAAQVVEPFRHEGAPHRCHGRSFATGTVRGFASVGLSWCLL
jgi:hypothetical protein